MGDANSRWGTRLRIVQFDVLQFKGLTLAVLGTLIMKFKMSNYAMAGKIKQAVTTLHGSARVFAEVGDLENCLILIKYYKRLRRAEQNFNN